MKNIDYYWFVKQLAEIGGILGATYSEDSQDTGNAFLEGLEIVEELKTSLNSLDNLHQDFNQREKDNLISLLDYFKSKLERRATAVGSNATN